MNALEVTPDQLEALYKKHGRKPVKGNLWAFNYASGAPVDCCAGGICALETGKVELNRWRQQAGYSYATIFKTIGLERHSEYVPFYQGFDDGIQGQLNRVATWPADAKKFYAHAYMLGQEMQKRFYPEGYDGTRTQA